MQIYYRKDSVRGPLLKIESFNIPCVIETLCKPLIGLELSLSDVRFSI